MKKIIIMAAFASVLASCNSGNGTNGSGENDTTANPTPGILNANGNLPDTSNAMGLSTSDSTVQHGKDSLNDIGGDTTNKNNTGANRKK